MPRTAVRSARRLAAAAACLVAAGCAGDAVGPGPPPPPPPPPPPDVAALFAPPTAAEIDQVRQEWAARTPVAVDARVELEEALTIGSVAGQVRIVSHVVDGNRHYGAFFIPGAAPSNAPLVAFLHGGDGGVTVPNTDTDWLIGGVDGLGPGFIYVFPSFRSEELRVGTHSYVSEGEPSPWDRDVDDALALIDAAGTLVQEADPSRVAAVGVSRGGLVALLMAARDPSIDVVIELAGPTNFFATYVQAIVELAIGGTAPNLPGLDVLDERFIQPWADGALPLATIRAELVRRSAVLFADDLPPTQVHHGTADFVVPVDQAQALIDRMAALGRTPPEFESFLYDGGTHAVVSLAEAPGRATALLEALWPPPSVQPSPPPPPPTPLLSDLYAAPTGGEVSAIRADWGSRQHASVDAVIVQTVGASVGSVAGEVRAISHTSDGRTHYGSVFVPNGVSAGSAPIILYAHPGDGGVATPGPNMDYIVNTLAGLSRDFVYAFPSFRGENLRVGSSTYASGGPSDPWGRDVDDALSFVEVVKAIVPEADGSRIAAVGVSRGGLVATLMGARSGQIDGVVTLAGPTDFYDPWIQGFITDMFNGQPAARSGLDVINARYLQPWKNGQISLAEMRAQLIGRSVVYFASSLPPTQLHHGLGDTTVDPSQAQSLIAAMGSKSPPDFEAFLYSGATHNVSTMSGSTGRIRTFIETIWP